MFSKEMIISLSKWMLTQILFHIKETFLKDKLMLPLLKKLEMYPNRPTFIKWSCSLTINSKPHLAIEKIASVTENQFVKLVKKMTSFFKKKNPDVPKCETMV